MCHEQENVRLLARTGLKTIVTGAGGNLIAASTRRPHLVDTLQDLLNVGGALRLDERRVRPEEAGKYPKDLGGIVVVRVYRGGECFNSGELPQLEAGDVLVFVQASEFAA
jgi:voltage-gated potassium channel